jgi:hypothetical protein
MQRRIHVQNRDSTVATGARPYEEKMQARKERQAARSWGQAMMWLREQLGQSSRRNGLRQTISGPSKKPSVHTQMSNLVSTSYW